MSISGDFFKHIDSEHKAYVLGWIAAKGTLNPEEVKIKLDRSLVRMLELLRSVIDKELLINEEAGEASHDVVTLALSFPQIVQDVCHWLQVEANETDFCKAQLPALEPDLLWSFIRGLFDANGEIKHAAQTNHLHARFYVENAPLMQAIQAFAKIPMEASSQASQYYLALSDNNALDFLGNLYDTSTVELAEHKEIFVQWCVRIPGVNSAVAHWNHSLNFRWVKVHEQAVAPFKGRVSDSGYDLTLIDQVKQVGLVTFFDTGIQIQPGYGWYFDLVPRSSISKTGYMLANSVGIIDRTYTGNVLVPLIKVDQNMPDLTLPARVVQIIPRPIVHGQWQQVSSFEATERGAGGFGSSGK
ncbi:MAG TPA: hypothetical protein DCS93_33605 [Microscillaceae bacterium]|nr:hypothetical protein [Microscillaceae bacterium]